MIGQSHKGETYADCEEKCMGVGREKWPAFVDTVRKLWVGWNVWSL
jgi:hypothetical protein